jgi:hypothetical protein
MGCDRTALRIRAARGAWVTVRVAGEQLALRVESGGSYVASNGVHPASTRNPDSTRPAAVTFQQVRSGLVTYDVGVSASWLASPATPAAYRATATLAGKAFDREGECFVGSSGVDQLTQPDDGKPLALSVRLVTAPGGAAAMRTAARALVETYRRIGIVVRVSFDTVPLAGYATYPFEAVQRAYGGVRPPGVDVVHVMTDDWSGGFADCLGGVAYPERGFSVGSLTYTVGGVVPVPVNGGVPAGMVAAHEIGHELGAQHQMMNCAEAVPQQVQQPASDGWVGACTLMGPLALQASETFSTLEKATIRSFVRRYAGRDGMVRPRGR